MIIVNRVVTISLREDVVRQEQACQELKKLQLQPEFFLPDPDKNNRERGCFNSHWQVACDALKDGKESVLIFEDDVKILPFTDAQIAAINQFLIKNKNQFDVFYLGLIIDKMWRCGQYPIVRARGAGCHAYILSRVGMEKLCSYSYQGTPIDKIIKRDFKCYSIYPIIANQYPKHIAQSVNYSKELLAQGEADERFWAANLAKQKGILRRNFIKSIAEWFRAQ